MQKVKHDVSLGANIRTLRNSCGLTRGSYAKIEAGIQNISVQELLAMKEVFHADLKDFFRTADEDYG